MALDDVAGETHKAKQRSAAASRATDNRPAIDRLYSAYRDLLSQGWREALYAPKDGTEIEIIELGSTGVFKAVWCSFGHEPMDTCGSFFGQDGGDTYPCRVAVWRAVKSPKVAP